MEPMETVDQGGTFAAMGVVVIFYLAYLALMIVSGWKIFSKAGRPGWASIVPIYNIIVFFDIIGRPLWHLLLLLIPFYNIVVLVKLIHRLSVVFGQGVGTTLLLIFLPFIGYPMLAFGSAKYTGTVPAPQPI
jgi:hypothetical protein